MLKINEKQLVVPGELIAEGPDYLAGDGIFREGSNLYSSGLGLAEVRGKFIKLIPLAGRYLPKADDTIIGVVSDTMFSAWAVDINGPYDGVLPLASASERFIERGEELSRYFDVGDVILTNVREVTKNKHTTLTMRARGLRKLIGGRIITVSPAKVPRVIGKGGTMVTLIKQATNSDIVVGQNGRIWINASPEKEQLVIKAIKKIEREAHISGLTERIKKLLGESDGKETTKADSKGKKA